MTLTEYLTEIEFVIQEEEQQNWFKRLKGGVEEGVSLLSGISEQEKRDLLMEFKNRVRTEEIKAWYSEPLKNSLFQGTSISSLIIPNVVREPLKLVTMKDLEIAVATAYIQYHNQLKKVVRNTIIEDVGEWIDSGLFYGVVISSKLISQALGLFVDQDKVICDIGGIKVDPHELTSYPQDTREEYYREMQKRLHLFKGLNVSRSELESSLTLADFSKPKIEGLRNKIILAPIRCNEITCLMSRHIIDLIREESEGIINSKSLAVVIYDTDTPYTYHNINGWHDNNGAPILPGLTILGSSGTIDAFRWLYAYRVSLLAQKIMKSSLYSQANSRFIPFVFYGVLIPRDAEILLETENLSRLRNKGNLSPRFEYAYILPQLHKTIKT